MLPRHCREVRLRSRPLALPGPEHLEIAERRLDVAADQVVVRNRFFRVSASLRMMVSEGAAEVPGVPIPALRPGDALAGEAVGEVVSAPPGTLAIGAWVRHPLGWRDYAVLAPSAVERIEVTRLEPAAHLSHGGTAYAALTRGVVVRPGDTVLVTSAAGAIGSMAGQLARQFGAGRVIGTTSSPEKAKRLVADLGYDAAVTRGPPSFATQLAAAAPGGVDVVVDSVGGEQLQAAISVAREGARVLILGALSGQLAATGTGRSAPVVLDSFQLLLRKITLRGYSADDDPAALADWPERFAAGLQSGELRFPHEVIPGLDRAPGALRSVAEGRHFGTVLVSV